MPAVSIARRALLSSLLASPPAVRSAVFGSSTTIVARHLPFRSCFGVFTHRSTAEYVPRGYISGSRFLSSPATSTAPRPDPATAESPKQRSRARRLLFTSTLFLLSFAAGCAMAVAPVSEAVNGFLHPPTDEETLSLFEPATPTAAEINEHIINHPLAQKLRTQPGMRESRPHLKIPPAMRPHNLMGGILLGENKIEVPPLTFSDNDAELPTLVQMSYLGSALCGHPGIVHGGLLATMLDEGLARACFPALPNKVGVTASLKIDYRAPCPGNSYVVLKAQTTKVEGRKAWVKGWIEILGDDDGNGTKVVEAEALFIEPKQAKQMARVYSTQ